MNSGYDLPGGLGPVRERIIDDPWFFLSVALILLVVVYVVLLGLTEVIFSIRKGKGKRNMLRKAYRSRGSAEARGMKKSEK
ncbi:hypothetical protein B1L87_14350 [Salmonella enterica subsp. enterica serovar Dublin]|nr:hypothetical protein B1L87_14350 [Salmonella enterica subsp. enterica serovar Dublin]